MKLTSTPPIVFAIILTIWLHVAVGWVEDFSDFLGRLEDEIQSTPTNVFWFTQTENVIEKLKNTPNAFKADCIASYESNCDESESRMLLIQRMLSTSSVQSTALSRFQSYSQNLDDIKSTMLWRIHRVDPIGFLAHLNGKDAHLPWEVAEHIVDFYRRMPLPPPFDQHPLETGSTSSGNTELETGSTSRGNTELETGSTSRGNTELETGSTSSDNTELETESSSSGDRLECPICLQTLKPDAPDRWAHPICRHAYHHGCIQKWIDECRGKAICPICRSPIQG